MDVRQVAVHPDESPDPRVAAGLTAATGGVSVTMGYAEMRADDSVRDVIARAESSSGIRQRRAGLSGPNAAGLVKRSTSTPLFAVMTLCE